MVKQGRLRVQQNVLIRRHDNEELAMGIAKGPVSAQHRWVMFHNINITLYEIGQFQRTQTDHLLD